MAGLAIGIDLGISYSSVAVAEKWKSSLMIKEVEPLKVMLPSMKRKDSLVMPQRSKSLSILQIPFLASCVHKIGHLAVFNLQM